MIVVDIESSGIFIEKCGIWQIGAVDLETGKEFLEDSRIDDEDIIVKEACIVTGRSEEEMRDKNKQSQKQLLENFFKWCKEISADYIIGHNVQFDIMFLQIKAREYGLKIPYSYRAFDLHTIAQVRYFQIKDIFVIKEDEKLGLPDIIDFVGLEDERIQLKDGEVVKEGKPHNALEDARLEAECFSRLIFGKNFIEDYKKFEIPGYLKK